MKNKKPTVLVAMSGGVDSSVVAAMLAEEGKYNLIGVFMKFWEEDEIAAMKGEVEFGQLLRVGGKNENKCCSVDSYEGGRRVADKYGFPLYTLNFRNTFKEKVVDNFIAEYKAGNTPNPCVNCNKYVKFGELMKRADELGCDYIATGHYARISKDDNGFFHLMRAKDRGKDQSYMMYNFTQDHLKRILFPLGEFEKDEVRQMAEERDLIMARRPDSQEVCFYKEQNQTNFLKRNLDMNPGPIVNKEGEQLGEHEGLPLYTLGQRRGIKIGGTGPYYVVKMDKEKNTLVVSNDRKDPMMYSQRMLVEKVNWVPGREPDLPKSFMISPRYHQFKSGSVLSKEGEGTYLIHFDEPQRALMSGQSAAFYDGDRLIGGGIMRDI